MNEIYSKIHDERRCVTSKSLCIDFGITRLAASQLLEAVPYYFDEEDCVYEVTRYIWNKLDCGKRVARLQKSQVHSSKSEPSKKSKHFIYSITLSTTQNGSPSPYSGHIYTMTLLRDALLLKGATPAILHPKLACDSILPTEEVNVLTADMKRQIRISNTTSTNSDKTFTDVTKRCKLVTSTTNVTKTKKTTTASSFFGTRTSAVIKKRNGGKKDTSEHLEEEKKISKKIDKNEGKAMTSDVAEKEDIKYEEKKTKRRNASNKRKEDKKVTDSVGDGEEKKTKRQKAAIQRKEDKKVTGSVGDADDFIGDEEEDDDFLTKDKERQQRNAIAARKLVRRNAEHKKQEIPQRRTQLSGKNDTDQNKEEEEEVIQGAMDVYTASGGDEQKGAKRRKQVLEEKTYVDEDGFFRTETVAVWKEVDDKEELNGCINDSSVSTTNRDKNSSRIKNKKKNMKQQGLMGFFSAKKK